MKRNRIVSQLCIFVIPLAVFSFCSSPVETNNKQSAIEAEECVEVSEVNPNGDSELALLMRKLFEDADSLRSAIQAGTGNIDEDYIKAIEQCHTATPTDPDVKSVDYQAFTNLLAMEAKTLMNAEDNHVEHFNSMVGKCIDCHNTLCPGPIKRIKKLYIK